MCFAGLWPPRPELYRFLRRVEERKKLYLSTYKRDALKLVGERDLISTREEGA